MRNRSTVIACKLLIFLVISSAVNLINAQDWAPGSNGQVMWAMNCEFAGPSIASQNRYRMLYSNHFTYDFQDDVDLLVQAKLAVIFA